MSTPLRGSVYGLSIRSARPITDLPAIVSGWPEVEVVELGDEGPARPTSIEVDEQRATMPLDPTRHLLLERAGRRAMFCGESLEPESLAHPYIGPVGTVFARWDGREAFHAGGFSYGGRTVAVLGGKEAGKSTLLAALSAAGATLVADDLIITDGRHAFAGPRCVDLRPDTLLRAPLSTPVRAGERHRVRVGATPPKLALSGWLLLSWGEGPTLEPVPASELLALLARWRAWNALPSDPAQLLELAALPAWELRRPRTFRALGATVELLLRRFPSRRTAPRRIPAAGPRPR